MVGGYSSGERALILLISFPLKIPFGGNDGGNPHCKLGETMKTKF